MSTGADLQKLALILDGTIAAPHFDRTAFKVARTFVTLGSDGLEANFKFLPDEQELKCLTHPEAFSPVPGGWGRQGWTNARLDALSTAELQAALEMAWRHAQKTPQKAPKKTTPKP